MLVSEKGLVRALKDAYRRQGYTVLNSGTDLMIYTPSWYVRTTWEELPRKALSTIVEHMGVIPSTENALYIKKDADPQAVLQDIVGKDVSTWLQDDPGELVYMTPLVYCGSRVFQSGDMQCYAADERALGIVEDDAYKDKGACVFCNGEKTKRMGWAYGEEMVVISTARVLADNGFYSWMDEAWRAFESVNLVKPKEE